MNWYKRSQHSTSNWNEINAYLKEKLGREPSTYEVQEEMKNRRDSDAYKEDLSFSEV